MSQNVIKICDLTHPHYVACQAQWDKWRLVYQGGDEFVANFLKQFSSRESAEDFAARKGITPVAAFAKAAVNDVKNSIYQRLVDIMRSGGSKDYQAAITGKDGGVDQHGSTMTSFIGRFVLPEMLSMRKVGVYIDMPPIDDQSTLADVAGKHPYIYMYRAEDIRSWAMRPYTNTQELQSVLLRDWIFDLDDNSGLPIGTLSNYRHLWLDPITGFVNIQFYDSSGSAINPDGSLNPIPVPIQLNIKRIPFVIFEISESLLADISNHQIALTNMESSDVAFVLKSNIPFYTEMQDTRGMPGNHLIGTPNGPNQTGEDGNDNKAQSPEITVGATQGRIYGKGLDRPDFIAPPTENLVASMQKQERLKNDIRTLINLAISNLQPRMASAESKTLDERGLEAGLSYIGLELEHGESLLAEIWALFEGTKDIATVKYPERYSLQSEEDRRKDADANAKIMDMVPSPSFRREIAKKITNIVLGARVPAAMLEKIHKEVDEAPGTTGNAEIIINDHEAGLVSDATASKLRGYPDGEVEQAQKDKAKRLELIAKSQTTGIRGATDAGNQQSKADKGVDPKTGDQKQQRGQGQ